jgi:hypothetical protein
MSVVNSYSITAGTAAKSPSEWPSDCPIERSAERDTFLMFLHPRCPCSRASLRELARVMAQVGDRLDVLVVFFQPDDEPNAWARTDLWTAATLIPGVRIATDVGGKTASRFGAATSGQVLLYDAAGRLLFSGGITAGRGHEGDNLGRRAVMSLVRGTEPAENSCQVFGCPILESKPGVIVESHPQ